MIYKYNCVDNDGKYDCNYGDCDSNDNQKRWNKHVITKGIRHLVCVCRMTLLAMVFLPRVICILNDDISIVIGFGFSLFQERYIATI